MKAILKAGAIIIAVLGVAFVSSSYLQSSQNESIIPDGQY